MRYVDHDNEVLVLYIAVLLGYSSNQTDSWPRELIDRILLEANKAATRSVDEQVRFLLGTRS